MPSTLRWAHLENLRSACASGLDFDEGSLKKNDLVRRRVDGTRFSQVKNADRDTSRSPAEGTARIGPTLKGFRGILETIGSLLVLRDVTSHSHPSSRVRVIPGALTDALYKMTRRWPAINLGHEDLQ